MIKGALSTPSYLLSLLRELSRVVVEISFAKKAQKKQTIQVFCGRFPKRVRKERLTFRNKDCVDFVFEGFRSTLKVSGAFLMLSVEPGQP